jgi:hypothetical protein
LRRIAPNDLERGHALRPYLVELRRDARVTGVDLEPFTRAEFADHVAALRGAPVEVSV